MRKSERMIAVGKIIVDEHDLEVTGLKVIGTPGKSTRTLIRKLEAVFALPTIAPQNLRGRTSVSQDLSSLNEEKLIWSTC